MDGPVYKKIIQGDENQYLCITEKPDFVTPFQKCQPNFGLAFLFSCLTF
jgi:hypothetical protein